MLPNTIMPALYLGFYLDVITLENIFTRTTHHTEKRTQSTYSKREAANKQLQNFTHLLVVCRVDVHYLLDVTLCSWVKTRIFKNYLLLFKD